MLFRPSCSLIFRIFNNLLSLKRLVVDEPIFRTLVLLKIKHSRLFWGNSVHFKFFWFSTYLVSWKWLVLEGNGPKLGSVGQVLSVYRVLWSSSVPAYSEVIQCISVLYDLWHPNISTTTGHRVKQRKSRISGGKYYFIHGSLTLKCSWLFSYYLVYFRFLTILYIEKDWSWGWKRRQLFGPLGQVFSVYSLLTVVFNVILGLCVAFLISTNFEWALNVYRLLLTCIFKTADLRIKWAHICVST